MKCPECVDKDLTRGNSGESLHWALCLRCYYYVTAATEEGVALRVKEDTKEKPGAG